jgi:type II secretory pathway predicted ATPase ExeA
MDEVATLVLTSNVKKVKRRISTTIRENNYLAIIADVGVGKTHLFNHLARMWESRPEKYVIIKGKAFLGANSRVPSIMKRMIRELEPDIKVPGDIESRYEVLEECLRKATHQGKKVILAIDEAQDLSLQTFRDLKKIHEISSLSQDNLFSILLFGKHGPIWDSLFKTAELGFRISRTSMNELSRDEIIAIAEERFKISFSGSKAKNLFSSKLRQKTPLAIKNMCDIIIKLSGFEGKVTSELIQEYSMTSIKGRLSMVGARQIDVLEKVKEMYPRSRANKGTISDTLNGRSHIDIDSEASRKIFEAADVVVTEKAKVQYS